MKDLETISPRLIKRNQMYKVGLHMSATENRLVLNQFARTNQQESIRIDRFCAGQLARTA
jgi:hypothetical protein